MEYTFYKIFCKDESITDCYVGKTSNFNIRQSQHKSNCNNSNKKDYKIYLYEYIRNNGDWDNWNIEVLEKVNCNEEEAKVFERKWYNELHPTLNTQIPNNNKINRRKTIICECGGKYTYEHKTHHLKTKKHLTYLSKNIIC